MLTFSPSVLSDEFRIALLTRATTTRVYANSKSAWTDFATAYDKLMDACVRQKGTGGAYLVPRMFLRPLLFPFHPPFLFFSRRTFALQKQHMPNLPSLFPSFYSQWQTHRLVSRHLLLHHRVVFRLPVERVHDKAIRHQSGYLRDRFLAAKYIDDSASG